MGLLYKGKPRGTTPHLTHIMKFETLKKLNQFIGDTQDKLETPATLINYTIQDIEDYDSVEDALNSISLSLAQCFYKVEYIGGGSEVMEELRVNFLRHWYNPYKYEKTQKYIRKNNITNFNNPQLLAFIKSLLGIKIKSNNGFG